MRFSLSYGRMTLCVARGISLSWILWILLRNLEKPVSCIARRQFWKKKPIPKWCKSLEYLGWVSGVSENGIWLFCGDFLFLKGRVRRWYGKFQGAIGLEQEEEKKDFFKFTLACLIVFMFTTQVCRLFDKDRYKFSMCIKLFYTHVVQGWAR